MYERKLTKYEYMGAVFGIYVWDGYHGSSSKADIEAIYSWGDVLELPCEFRGVKVQKLDLSSNGWGEKKQTIFPEVRKLVVRASVGLDTLRNNTFPDLEEIEVEASHEHYTTDGKMLFNKKGDQLILALVAGMRDERVVVPAEVKKIGKDAFFGTCCIDIVFENPDVELSTESLSESAWLKKKGEKSHAIYVGNTLYSLSGVDDFILDPSCTRIMKDAIKHIPRKMTSHIVPPYNEMRPDRRSYSYYIGVKSSGCEDFTLTSDRKISLHSLWGWDSLKAVYLPNHSKYVDVDGVIFSKDLKTLYFYPQKREAESYRIPEGTEVIAQKAFFGQCYLKRVEMPNSVRWIRQGAFAGCKELEEVELSENITEIADASVFLPYGVFEGCDRLLAISLPRGLRHIGSNAFCGCSALKEVNIDEGVEMIGVKAFWDCSLAKVRLPRSLRIIDRGALGGGVDGIVVEAHEGTARGLIGAIEAVGFGSLDSVANVVWKKASIRMLTPDGSVKDTIVIPESLKRSTAANLDLAWNQSEFDYDLYDECFEDIQDKDEKVEFALRAVNLGRVSEDYPYSIYLRRVGSKIFEDIVEKCDEESVVGFLKQGYLSAPALKKALAVCNKKGMTTAAAYILSQIGEDRAQKKKTKTRAIQL